MSGDTNMATLLRWASEYESPNSLPIEIENDTLKLIEIVDMVESCIGREFEDDNEKRLLDEAEQSYNRIVDAITNNCINGMPNNTESLSPISQVPGVHGIGGSSKIFDTRNLSQVNFVYNNITFQVHPGPKISNESYSVTDVMPGEDESDTYNFSQVQQE
jgi:hypothetical protein